MCLFCICINILKCELLKISCHNIIEDVLLEKKSMILLFLFAMVVLWYKVNQKFVMKDPFKKKKERNIQFKPLKLFYVW